MRWLGAPEDDINRMIFDAMKAESSENTATNAVDIKKFTKKELPEGALPLSEWIEAELDTAMENQLADIVQYVINRGFDPLSSSFLWTPAEGFSNRVIIPFTFEGEVVGWTARKITDGKPKYLSDQHPNYVFNIDAITRDQDYVFVVEGPLDALAINGVALLHNDISAHQAALINQLGKTVIVVPDRDSSGIDVIKKAIELDWAVAFPNWDDDVKDAADAVKKYGDLFVVTDLVNTSIAGNIRINIYLQKFQKMVEKSSR
jgi:hypothetical protein